MYYTRILLDCSVCVGCFSEPAFVVEALGRIKSDPRRKLVSECRSLAAAHSQQCSRSVHLYSQVVVTIGKIPSTSADVFKRVPLHPLLHMVNGIVRNAPLLHRKRWFLGCS